MKQENINGEIIGKIIRKKRKAFKANNKKWTIAYLAEQANIDEDHLQKLETGKTANPYYDTIGRITDALGLNKDEFWQEYIKEKANYFSDE